MQHGYQCGMIWGAALGAGAEAYHRYGSGPQAETAAILAAQKVVEAFRALNHNINCLEITEIDKASSTMQMITYFLIKGGTIHCLRMAGRYGPVVYQEIDAALSPGTIKMPAPPVSCAALLARKMGASERQQVMAAGLAGGIGLCGGACGALGAAVWLSAIRSLEQEGRKPGFTNPRGSEVIEKFIKSSDYEFECAAIAGRRFENVADHAEYLREGGCGEIIEALAATFIHSDAR